MGLTKYKLGELVQLEDARNIEGAYLLKDVKGISIQKIFIETKADMADVSLSPYIVVKPDFFAYVTVTSRNGEKITLAHNNTKDTFIVSSSYIVFSISRQDLLIPEYMYMFFNRPEFDRYSRFNSWGSARETFSWDEMCDIDIELPSIPTQQKYVDIYKAMVANQQNYERGLEDLKLTVDAFLEKYKYSTKRVALGDVIQESDMRNTEGKVVCVHGVNKDKLFMPSVASGEDIKNYKLVKRGSFACNLMHIGRDVVVPIALNTSDETRIVSPAYVVFDIDNTVVLPEFVLMWLSRVETDRRTWFMCDSSVRSGMEKKRFFEITIPQPPLVEQQTLVNLHRTLAQRREINERLKTQIKDICPILIKGSLEEGK